MGAIEPGALGKLLLHPLSQNHRAKALRPENAALFGAGVKWGS
jgi:hypothetical protein